MVGLAALAVAIPIVYTAIASRVFASRAEAQIGELSAHVLRQSASHAELIVDVSKRFLYDTFHDADIQRYLTADTPSQMDIHAALLELTRRTAAYPFLHSCYLYNGENQSMVGTYSYPRRDADLHDERVRAFLRGDSRQLIRLVPRTLERTPYYEAVDVVTVLVANAPQPRGHRSAVLANVPLDSILSLSAPREAEIDIDLAIVANDERVFDSGADAPRPLPKAWKEAIEQIRTHDRGYSVVAEGEKTILTTVHRESLDWTFVAAVPYSAVSGALAGTRLRLITIAAALLLTGLCVAIVLARALYRPIRSLLRTAGVAVDSLRQPLNEIELIGTIYNRAVERAEALLARGHEEALLARDEGLRSLLVRPFGPKERERRLAVVADELPDEPLRLVLFRMRGGGEVSEDASSTLQLAVTDLVNDLVARTDGDEGATVVALWRRELALLVGSGRTPWNSAKDTRDELSRIVTTIAEEVGVHLIAATVEPCGAVALHPAYNRARRVADYSLVRGYNRVLDADVIGDAEKRPFTYPQQAEEELLGAFQALDRPRFGEALRGWIEDARRFQIDQFRFVMNQFAAACIERARLTLAPGDFGELPSTEELYQELTALGSPDDVEHWFTGLFEWFERTTSRALAKSPQRQVSVVSEAAGYVDANLADPNLSVESVADEFGLSRNYFGRLFKELRGVTLTEYVNAQRVNRACELLRGEGEESVRSIATMVGIQNVNYFYHLFKKQLGMTPTQYRRLGSRAHSAVANDLGGDDRTTESHSA
jgi:AraC-like DNA-binding protein